MRLYNNTSKLATQLSWLIAIILVLLPFHAVFTTWAGSNFGHLDVWRVWKEILFLLMLPPATWMVWRTPKLRQWFVSSSITKLFGLYILLHLVLGGWALWHGRVNSEALVYSYIINLRFIAFFILCAILAGSSGFLTQNWRKILLAPAAIVVVFGLVQKFLLPYDFLKHLGYGPATIPAYQTVDQDFGLRRIQSTLRGANPLGAYLVLIIPALWLSKARPWKQIKQWLAIGAAFVVLFFTYSRSAEIGVAITLAIMAWWGIGQKTQSLQGRALQGWKLGIFVSTTLILVVGGLYTFRNNSTTQDTLFHTSKSSTSDVTSNEARTQAIKAGALDVIHEPLGRGVGTAGPASFRNDAPPRIAENYFLQIGQEVGVLGMGLIIAINALVAKQLWRSRQELLAKILLASFVGITFVNLVSHAWTDDTLAYLWWGLAGMSLAPILSISKKRV